MVLMKRLKRRHPMRLLGDSTPQISLTHFEAGLLNWMRWILVCGEMRLTSGVRVAQAIHQWKWSYLHEMLEMIRRLGAAPAPRAYDP
jgi:hypothetical protein